MRELCAACGLCCNGVLFADVRLQPGDDPAQLRSLGLPLCAPRSAARLPRFGQPCAAFEGSRCRLYADRPTYCREFECVLLQSAKAGRTQPAAALSIIRTARERAEKVHRLLRTLGNTDDQLPLSARFRHTSKRVQQQELTDDAADTYAQLTLAVHDLNLLLGDAFYPGSAAPKRRPGTRRAAVCAAFALLTAAGSLPADQIELKNGDRYAGHVLSVTTNTVVLQSDELGTLRLARSRVAVIKLGATPTNTPPALPLPTNAPLSPPTAASTNTAANLSPALSGLGASTNLIQQVQRQFLSGAGAEANDKFNELLGGLMSGKLSVDDIRAQAKAAADQLRALQRDSGEDASLATSAYLSILDHFLKDTAPAVSATNASGRSSNSKSTPAQQAD